jgi:hypothetical protein
LSGFNILNKTRININKNMVPNSVLIKTSGGKKQMVG